MRWPAAREPQRQRPSILLLQCDVGNNKNIVVITKPLCAVKNVQVDLICASIRSACRSQIFSRECGVRTPFPRRPSGGYSRRCGGPAAQPPTARHERHGGVLEKLSLAESVEAERGKMGRIFQKMAPIEKPLPIRLHRSTNPVTKPRLFFAITKWKCARERRMQVR